jgi:hypothetical protein
MRPYLICLPIVAVLAMSGAVMLAADDKEQEVKLEQLPSLVKATLLKEAGDGKVVEIVKLTNGNVITYEADVVVGKAKWELRIAADGKLLSKQLDDDDDDGPDDDDDDDAEDED